MPQLTPYERLIAIRDAMVENNIEKALQYLADEQLKAEVEQLRKAQHVSIEPRTNTNNRITDNPS